MKRSSLLAQAIALMEAGEDCTGICIKCGYEQGEVEPDASEYECEDCGEEKVMGAEEILVRFS